MLIDCRECGRKISSDAPACPGCGAPVRSLALPEPQHVSPAMGIAGIVLGVGACLMPYFAAAFLVPASLVCGFIAYRKGHQGMGVTGIILGIIGLIGVLYTSQQLSNIMKSVP